MSTVVDIRHLKVKFIALWNVICFYRACVWNWCLFSYWLFTVDGYTNGDVSYRKQHFVKASSCEMRGSYGGVD